MDSVVAELIKKRKLYLVGEVNFKNIKPIIQSLHYLNDGSNNDVYLYISSDGGFEDAGFSLIETMNLVDYDINTIIMGECCSMGPIISVSGTIGKRWMCKKSAVMMHQSSEEFSGQISDVKKELEAFERTDQLCCEILAKQTGRPIKEVMAEWNQKDVWLTYKEALKGGIVDGLWTKAREIASNKPGKMKPATKEKTKEKQESKTSQPEKPQKETQDEPQRNDQNKV